MNVVVIAVQTFDSAANTQQEDTGAIWSFKGYANNAWHRIEVSSYHRCEMIFFLRRARISGASWIENFETFR